METNEIKELLVYLYETFDGSQTKIIDELMQNNLKASNKACREFIQANNICIDDYIAFFEKNFPEELKNEEKPTLIIKSVDTL